MLEEESDQNKEGICSGYILCCISCTFKNMNFADLKAKYYKLYTDFLKVIWSIFNKI